MNRTDSKKNMQLSNKVKTLSASSKASQVLNRKISNRTSKQTEDITLKKIFLSKYSDNEREIRRLEEEICRWESRAAKVTSSLSHNPSHRSDDRIQSAVDEIVELRNILYDRLLDATELRRSIDDVIAAVPEQRLRLLLEYRYIEGMTWERVAAALTCDYRWTLRLHDRALAALSNMPEQT